MKKKIFRYTSISMAVILILSMLTTILLVNQHFISTEEERMAAEAELACAGIDTGGEDYLNSLDAEDYRITWIAEDGTVLYDSETDASKMENHSDRKEFKEALLDGTGEEIRYSDTMAIRTIYYAMRCADGSVVRLAETYDTAGILTLRMLSPIILIIIAALIVSSLLAGRLSREIADPINNVDLDHPLEKENYAEITPLLKRIDSQNSQIEEQIEQLHQRKKEFDAVIKNITEGLIIINMNQEILSVNEAAVSLFELAEKPAKIADITGDPAFPKLVEQVLSGEPSETYIKIGSATLKADANPIRSHGTQIGAGILVQDVTEDYEMEMTRREFTANVSHELKTPLQSIMGYSELMENHLVDPKDQDKFAHKIHDESCRMLQLIDDIIRLSQLDENQDMETNLLDLKDLACEAKEAVSAEAAEHHVELKFDCKTAKVNANSRLIYEIFYNLMDNAIRYNRENGFVKVSTWCDDDESFLEVSDNGIGIPRDSVNHIFERFYRVDKSHSRATGGTGLGLSIVKHAVLISHGHINVNSKLGTGSTFTVRFPVAK